MQPTRSSHDSRAYDHVVNDAGSDLPRLRVETLDAIEATRRALERVSAARQDANSDDEHDPEGATIGFEQAQERALLESAEARLREIDAALEREASGAYGICERCGARIPDARLEVRPFARRCVACA